MRAPFYCAFACTALWMSACSNSDQAHGGGIWDETENGVALRIINAAASPVNNARVRLVPLKQWSQQVVDGNNPTLDSGSTNSDGELLLHTNQWPAALEVETDSTILRVILYGPDSALVLTPEKPAQLKGTLHFSNSFPARIHLAGSSWSTIVDSTGHFIFSKLPAGELALVARHSTGLSFLVQAQLHTNETVQLDSLEATPPDSVILDDFSNGGSTNRYNPLTGTGWWYTYSDSISTVIPNQLEDAIESGSSAWSGGPSLHAILQVDTNVIGNFALVGCDIEGSSYASNLLQSKHDLRTVDSITFWAKGSGTMDLQVYAIIDTAKHHMTARFTLTNAWTRYTIIPSNFRGASYTADSTLLWNDIAPSIVGFGFIASSPAELWLDQLTLHGISDMQLFTTFSKL